MHISNQHQNILKSKQSKASLKVQTLDILNGYLLLLIFFLVVVSYLVFIKHLLPLSRTQI